MNKTVRRTLVTGIASIAVSTGLAAGPLSAASAAPIANSCGGVAVPGETQTTQDTYVVQKGDTLYRIVRDIYAARAAGPQSIAVVARGARDLRVLNATVVRKRGNLIFPGQVLRLPEQLRYCTKG